MNITIEQIQAIKSKAEQRRRAIDRAKGSLEQLLKTLKTDFDCENLEEAKKKLAELQDRGTTLSARIEKLKVRVVDLWEQVENPDNAGLENEL